MFKRSALRLQLVKWIHFDCMYVKRECTLFLFDHNKSQQWNSVKVAKFRTQNWRINRFKWMLCANQIASSNGISNIPKNRYSSFHLNQNTKTTVSDSFHFLLFCLNPFNSKAHFLWRARQFYLFLLQKLYFFSFYTIYWVSLESYFTQECN